MVVVDINCRIQRAVDYFMKRCCAVQSAVAAHIGGDGLDGVAPEIDADTMQALVTALGPNAVSHANTLREFMLDDHRAAGACGVANVLPPQASTKATAGTPLATVLGFLRRIDMLHVESHKRQVWQRILFVLLYYC
jgi:hypothetical protein